MSTKNPEISGGLPDYEQSPPEIKNPKERAVLYDVVRSFLNYPELRHSHDQLMRDLDDSQIGLNALVAKIQAALLEFPKDHVLVALFTIRRERLKSSITSAEETLSDT